MYSGFSAFGCWCGMYAEYGVPSGFGANRLTYGSRNPVRKNGEPGPCATELLFDLPKKAPADRSSRGVSA